MFKTYKKQWLGVFLSAILFTLMLPFTLGSGELPIQSWSCFFVWVFMLPLWISVRTEKPSTVLLFGFLFCFLSGLGTMYWVFIALQKYGDISAWISMLILVAMVFGIATFRFIGFFATSFFLQHKYFVAIATIFFSLTEWMMFSIPFGGVPWITPAHAVYPMKHLIQSLDLFGVQGMNVLIFAVNFLLVESYIRWKNRKKINSKISFALGLIFGALWSYGHIQLKRFEAPQSSTPLNVALVQGNISQDIKWSFQDRQDIIGIYQDLTVLASQSKPDLIVWPEASLPKTIPLNSREIPEVPENITAPMVIGAPTWFKENGKNRYKNSSFLVDGTGKILHRYDKIKLVPFGEFMPSFGPLSIERWIPAVAGNFSQGELNQSLASVQGHPFATFICFEVLFPSLAQAWVARGAEFFVNITNDAWFDDGSGPHQHVRFAAFRAIEFRKPIVRAANTGITTWYDAAGRQFDTLDLSERGFTFARIQPNRIRTMYSRFSLAVPALLCLVLGYIMIFHRKRT